MKRRRALMVGAASLVAPAARAQGIKQRGVRFPSRDGTMLAGTLLLPLASERQYVPGVVLVAGSGPTDRDGNNPLLPGRIDTLRLIAERLARGGIASLRYDKRGIGASTPSPPALAEQERFFTWGSFVADLRAAHVELLRHDEIKPYATALLGHSEGGLLALAALSEIEWRRPHALVLAATPGRPMGEIVRRQIARTAPGLVKATDEIMTAIRDTGHAPADLPRELQALFPPYIGPFLQGAFAFDPAKALAAIDTSCLLAHGGADSQIVPMDDIQPLIDVLGQRRGAGEALIVPAVSHNLKPVTSPVDPGFAGPLAPAIAEKIAGWLGFVLGA